MKKYFLAFPLILLLTVPLKAQDRDIRNVFFDTLRTSDVQPTPIGVDDMKFTGSGIPSHEDSVLMLYTTRIIQRDLDFYADFELVPIDSFYLRTYEITVLDLLGWMRLGANYVVKLETEFPGRNMKVKWRLYHTVNSQQIDHGEFEYNRAFWREIGHDIANEIVHTLTGEKGIFRTKIVYIRRLGKAKELFMADYDGANERQLTENGSINISPCFDPNQELVYFISYMEGDPQLYKVEINSGVITKVAGYPGMVAAPAVSPDGKRIACVLTKDGNSEIYVLDTEGRIIKRLTRTPSIETAPTWSPDGRYIAFSSDRTGAPQIYIMDSDGLDQHRVTFSGTWNDSPIWSRRGDRLTFVSRTKFRRFDIASVDTAGHDYRILTEVAMNENPHFSPDGKHIIFYSNRLSDGDIYSMDVSGRNRRRITTTGDCSNPYWGPVK
ncbi:MAG: Tol-Pal system beta propeller repeat protein TolB [candidate division Zixibacteria bacterium]|nr:Tol-Pal system beta propeller repeat protein TolB [candidate division Zixibacteria bacterium]